MKEFLLSDESLNSHDSIVMTDGIRLDRFLSNPVMFYNHDADKGVVGRWENVRKENGKLYGTPVFDARHELGRMLQQQVEDGFVRGASIGIGSVEYEYDPTNHKIMKIIGCELLEVSVCDIPSNSNTLQLYYDGKRVDRATHRRLALNQSMFTQPDAGKIMEALELPSDATIEQILAAIEKLKSGDSPLFLSNEEQINLAIKRGYIEQTEKAELMKDFRGNAAGLSAFIKHRGKSFEKDVENEYNNLLGKYHHVFNLTQLKAIPQNEIKDVIRGNFAAFKRLMECVKPFRRVMDDIVTSKPECTSRLNWTLEDYRKKDPMALKRDPALYEKLIKQKDNHTN